MQWRRDGRLLAGRLRLGRRLALWGTGSLLASKGGQKRDIWQGESSWPWLDGEGAWWLLLLGRWRHKLQRRSVSLVGVSVAERPSHGDVERDVGRKGLQWNWDVDRHRHWHLNGHGHWHLDGDRTVHWHWHMDWHRHGSVNHHNKFLQRWRGVIQNHFCDMGSRVLAISLAGRR